MVVDEAWILMRSGEGARFLFRMAKASRKRNAGLCVVTQDAADVLGSDLGMVSSARRMGPPDCHDLGATWLRGEHAGESDWCQRGRPWECRQARVRQAGEQCRAGRPVPVGVKPRPQAAQLVSLRGFVTPGSARWAACRQAGPQ